MSATVNARPPDEISPARGWRSALVAAARRPLPCTDPHVSPVVEGEPVDDDAPILADTPSPDAKALLGPAFTAAAEKHTRAAGRHEGETATALTILTLVDLASTPGLHAVGSKSAARLPSHLSHVPPRLDHAFAELRHKVGIEQTRAEVAERRRALLAKAARVALERQARENVGRLRKVALAGVAGIVVAAGGVAVLFGLLGG